MRLRHALLSVFTIAPLAVTAVPASAESCFGFPDMPDAYVCVVSVNPENAVPAVEPGSETVWIPEFCVAVCFGPTPLTIPVSAVTPNSGTVAVVRYKGQDYPISTEQPLPQGFPPAVGAASPSSGFAGHGCSMVAVENPAQPHSWLAVVEGGPIVATDPSNDLESWNCHITIDGDRVFGGNLHAPATIEYDGDTSALGLCLELRWTRSGDSQTEYVCASAVAIGTARVVV